MRSEFRDALILHAALGFVAAALFFLLHPPALGKGILALAIAYNLALPGVARWRGHREWIALWSFLLPLSVFQLTPDWMLSQFLAVLVFPDLGAPRLGTVPLFMAGLWVIPLFWVLLLGARSAMLAGVLSLLTFAGAEWVARPLHLWYAQGVRQSFGVAHYVLLPEALLGFAAAFAYAQTRSRSVLIKVAAAAAVSVFYSGALVITYFLSERASWVIR